MFILMKFRVKLNQTLLKLNLNLFEEKSLLKRLSFKTKEKETNIFLILNQPIKLHERLSVSI